MTEAPGPDTLPPAAAEIETMARDWITLWQSELAALGSDREAQESWIRLLSLWAGAANALLGALPASHVSEPPRDHHDPRAGTAPPAGAAPPAAASSPGDAALERLDRRLARLEERLAAIERQLPGRGGATEAGARPRRRPSRAGIPPGGPG
ncbi:MAG TPA: hypothetical protein VMA37_17380 [Acetobacteraceae bacterium]|nr:hypothetical protein [Acetobacteraceae bacterium]